MKSYSKKELFSLLEEIPDPEIPVLNIIDLGVVRDVKTTGNNVTVNITPTYSGCPAMKQMEDDIISLLRSKGFDKVMVNTVYDPAWTTDWIKEEAKEKLRQYGIAPPVGSSQDKSSLTGKEKIVKCPRCASVHTQLVSQFGSTACKALYRCKDCLEPFDYFKCI